MNFFGDFYPTPQEKNMMQSQNIYGDYQEAMFPSPFDQMDNKMVRSKPSKFGNSKRGRGLSRKTKRVKAKMLKKNKY